MNTMLRGSSATQKSKGREISCTAKAMPAPLASTIAARTQCYDRPGQLCPRGVVEHKIADRSQRPQNQYCGQVMHAQLRMDDRIRLLGVAAAHDTQIESGIQNA